MTDTPQPETHPITARKQIGLVWRYGTRFLLQACPALCGWYVLVALAASGAALLTPQVFGTLLNFLRGKQIEAKGLEQLGSTGLFVLWVTLLLVGTPVLNLIHQLLGARIDQHISTRMQSDVFRKILNQPLPFFDKNDSGSLLFLLREMCVDTQQAIRQLTIDPFMMLVTLAGGVSLVTFNLVQLASGGTRPEMWVVVGLLLVAALATPRLVGRFGDRLRNISTDLLNKNSALRSLARGGVQAPEEIKAFDAIDWFGRRQYALLKEVAEARVRQTVAIEKVNFVNTLPTSLVQVILVGAALALVVRPWEADPAANQDAKQVGYLVALLLLVPQLMRPLLGFSALLIMLQSSWPSIERVFGILESDSEESPAEDLPAAPSSAEPARVVVRDLTFRYTPGGNAILDAASFDLAAGKVTALVARMGEGKTTFLRLMMKFYHPESGSIAIDGRPLEDISLPELRRELTLMAQFPAFTHDSVRDNFLLAAPETSDDELVRTCRQTGIWPVLRRNLDGATLDADILDQPFASGNRLSGGQRKLFALTRCLLRNPRLLLLDEPTTGMDNVEKFELVARLRDACRGRSVLVVDHDVRWIGEFCDEILVLEGGAITARGSREELLLGQNLFRELYEKGESRETNTDPN